jgi:hypothetical protein
MKSPLIERNKIPGVQYALTRDGIELPVVDVTHPAFALAVTDTEMRAEIEKFLKQNSPLTRVPAPLRTLLLRILLRGSVLAKGIRQAEGTFMSGLHTYLLKLGPQMLGSAYAKPIDRRIASALPCMAVRLRLQDVSQLMADTLLPLLNAGPRRALHYLNIAGGPAIDSLNSLILLAKKQSGILAGREISITVPDLDDAGPTFGANALAALSQPDGPLHGIPIHFRHVPYDWSKADDLRHVLSESQAQRALVMCSSEGGLFEYGSDREIEENLRVLRSFPDVVAVVGSVTRADEPIQHVRHIGRAATRPRGLAVFRALIEKTGWRVVRAIERPFSDQVVLT